MSDEETVRDAFARIDASADRQDANDALDRLVAERDRLRETLNSVCNELGVPNDDYPAPVANAYWIARAALVEDES